MKISIVRTSTNNNSITGELYVDDEFICYTLELPFQDNKSQISSIPTGKYGTILRYDHPDQWRIELTETDTRKNIQIHIGNFPKNTQGCILVGGEVFPQENRLGKSLAAYTKLKTAFYGAPNPNATPHIDLVVEIKTKAEHELEQKLFEKSSLSNKK